VESSVACIASLEGKVTNYILESSETINFITYEQLFFQYFNPLTPKDPYSGRTTPPTSKRFILYIYSTNTGTEYFKHGIYCLFFLFKMQFVS